MIDDHSFASRSSINNNSQALIFNIISLLSCCYSSFKAVPTNCSNLFVLVMRNGSGYYSLNCFTSSSMESR